jgi:response regulator RpfG family c-di-GMP phosphodiesterase
MYMNPAKSAGMDNRIPLPGSAVEPPAKILCVDDEPNILSSLRRLFRGQGYQVLTAESGHAAVKVLEKETVDIVISDMRMPEMDGARFLACVRAHWPDTIRLLLTGYADIELIIDAINRGEVYRYINKPWDDNDILLVVRHALERRSLEREKVRLEALTRKQNEELRALNLTLESRVASRTAELRNMHDQLIRANEKLKTNYLTSIKVFSSIIEMRGKNLVGHSRRVADLARKISARMALSTQETQSVFIAGLLHNIGKIGFSDDLLAMPVSMMNGENLGVYRRYPIRGEQLLMPLEDLRDTAKIIRAHQERFDGEGFPDRLSGFDIPIGARILAVATDYDNLQIGVLSQRQCRPEQAAAIIIENRGKRYDASVIEAFHEIVIGRATTETLHDEPIAVSALKPGMVTSRDLVTKDGSLLLSADHVMNERLIQQIMDFEKKSGLSFMLYVRSRK